MEHFAQKTAQKGSLPRLGEIVERPDGNYVRTKYFYFVKGTGFPDGEPLYFVQHYLAHEDESGYLNAAKAMEKISRQPKFVAWYNSPEGFDILKRHGAQIARDMRKRFREDITELFGEEAYQDFSEPYSLPYLGEDLLPIARFYYVRLKLGNELEYVINYDTHSVDARRQWPVEKFIARSREKDFRYWTRSEKGKEYYYAHRQALILAHEAGELEVMFGRSVVEKGRYIDLSAMDAVMPERMYYYLTKTTDKDVFTLCRVCVAAELHTSRGIMDLMATLGDIMKRPDFYLWTHSDEGTRFYQNHADKLAPGPDHSELREAFRPEAFPVQYQEPIIQLEYELVEVHTGLARGLKPAKYTVEVGGELTTEESVKLIAQQMDKHLFSHWVYSPEAEAYFLARKTAVEAFRPAMFRRILAGMYQSVGA